MGFVGLCIGNLYSTSFLQFFLMIIYMFFPLQEKSFFRAFFFFVFYGFCRFTNVYGLIGLKGSQKEFNLMKMV